MKQSATTYITHQKIADYAVALTYANITIGHAGASSIISLSDLQGSQTQQALIAIKNLQSIRATDVLHIKNSDPDTDGLMTVIQQGEWLLSQSQSIADALQASMNESQSQVDTCTNQKSQADELYRQWLANNDANSIDQATTTAQQASTCISTANVLVKSINGVLINLKKEIETTKTYISVISTNQWLIKQYSDVLGSDIPAQLVQLQQQLQSL